MSRRSRVPALSRIVMLCLIALVAVTARAADDAEKPEKPGKGPAEFKSLKSSRPGSRTSGV